ncbi:hypothetical protein P3X46_000493 [Hevea brasiliensis]|uniref:RING-CH-type domain-containing protein n=1 Tax=Hevea brasiliensis TaxID=3981 RepID=A0ABQ9NB51_HEVBR|nr:uncharacterized protein LOC110652151 isoform X1 [Hevea brasiliensis]KAJ9189165.1 hypothetical protein P3X46_000493 [Hevea brasiliensis]
MVDDFMVCVDRIIASACFESVHGERDRNIEATAKNESVISVKCNGEGCSSFKKVKEMAECRICQEEDEVHSMEAPCACNGTLKFAHRKCIQRWCNKKGNITCEICNQVFSPNYSVPPACSNPDVMAIDIRQAWRESQLLALAAAERRLLRSEYEDYAVANTSSIACLRTIAVTLLVVLLLFQALLVTRDAGLVQESSTLFNFQVSLLRFAGFLLPCYVMARSCYVVQGRRRQG